MTLGILLFLISIFNLHLLSVHAEGEETPKAQSLETCLKKYPKFKPPDKKDDPYEPFKSDETLVLDSPRAFRVAFEEARNKYHAFIECVFDEAAKEILAADTGTDGFWSANTPNVPHLSEPDVACLDPETLSKIANGTGSGPLMPPLLKAYNAYTQYQKSLYVNFTKIGFENNAIEEAERVYRKTKDLVLNEIQDAITALHTSFAKLMELRQVFVMHVHFQCMLHNLEDYRRFLGELRSVIELLPPRIIDASMSK